MILKPRPGFDWNRVAWGLPDSPRSALCSYCFTSIADGDVPLMLCAESGHVAQFCAKCQHAWWGAR